MDKIYYNGDIITMEKEEEHPEAVLVADGKIKYVGTLSGAEKLSESETEKIDLKGKTLIPSFIDPHGHLSMMAQFSSFCQLSKCTTFEEIVTALNYYKDERKINEKGIILGCGYDHNFLKEQEHPTKEILDQVSSKIPIYIFHTSGHMGVANSALLALANITEETPDPDGGKFGHDKEGKLNGYVEETPAITKVLMAAFSRVKMDFPKQIMDAQQTYLSYGITTCQDGATGYQTMQGLAPMAANHMYQMDVVSYVMTDDYDKTVKEYCDYAGKYHNRLKIAGAKMVLDGSPQGKSAWLSEPYESEETYCGYPTHKDEEVEQQALKAVKEGYQLLCHCNGDAASEQFINSYQKALEDCPEGKEKDLRPVMIHCQTVRDDQLARMVSLQMIPSIYVAHTYYWGDIHLKNLGDTRGNHISPVKSALDKQLVYNFHQDPPVVAPDMLHTIWCAVNRQTRGGKSIGLDQAVNVYDAMKGVTINAAYAYHEEEMKGSIKEGKLADLVILDKNPLRVDKIKIKDIQVLETIKEGETIYLK